MATAILIESLRAGIRANFAQMWQQEYPDFRKEEEILTHHLPYINLRTLTLAWKDAIGAPKMWEYGLGRTYQRFGDRSINLTLRPYEMTLPIRGADREHSQLGDEMTHMQMSLQRYLSMGIKLISDHLNGQAVYQKGPLPLAYDGAAFFSALDGAGANRFSVVNGNLLPATGFSPANIITDVARCVQQWLAMRDPAGEPIFDAQKANIRNIHCFCPTGLDKSFTDATEAKMLQINLKNFTSEDNVYQGKFTYSPLPYLSDPAAYFVVLKHSFWKPTAFRGPGDEKGIRSIFADMQNSDHARQYDEEALYSDTKYASGPWAIFTIIKVYRA